MKERPILFNAPMIRAILKGQKTMTRRVINTGRFKQYDCDVSPTSDGRSIFRGSKDDIVFNTPCGLPARSMQDKIIHCPYGLPGDRLRVNEAWRVGAWSIEGQAIAVDYRADGFARREWLECPDEAMFLRLVEQSREDADKAGYGFNRETGDVYWEPGNGPTRWRSSRFMPRWASRIILEVTASRVERLQDISEENARAEGTTRLALSEALSVPGTWRAAFADLWNSINAKRGYGWDTNPWVWVVEFKRASSASAGEGE